MILVVAALLGLQSQPVVITRSGSFTPPASICPSADVDDPAIVIKGDDLVVDFNNKPLRGTPEATNPDQRQGLAVQVEGNNVTIRHARIQGYKVAILARNAKGLKIVDSDLSYNWKQHLKSTPEREDESDWMSYHHNDKDEWLHGSADVPAYGGAIYLRGCDDSEIRNVKVTGGQNGLMMTECNHALVWNNDFSFLSGLGIGMYRSSDNRIMHNKIDWCVRGYSHGVYNRGQDSAGVLIYEQSNRNVFAYNSVTHGGDGFFLWAGQTTMDSGQGGCNDNLVYGNDFSHAPTNGIEATFSRNAFINNKVVECWHGVWGGYSYDTKIQGNAFGLNAEAISIEHGQSNTISGNSFWRDNGGIELWANPNQDPNWGYPKHRDTASRDTKILDNYFGNIPGSVFQIASSTNVEIRRNRVDRFTELLKESKPNTGLVIEDNRLGTDQAGIKTKWSTKNVVEVAADLKSDPSTMLPGGGPAGGQDADPADYAKRFDVTWNPYPTDDDRRKDIEALAPKPLKGGKDPFLKDKQLRGRRYIIVDEWGPYDFKRPLLWPSTPLTAMSSTSIKADGTPGAPQGSQTRRYQILGPKGTWKVADATGATLSATFGDVPGFVDVTTPLYGATSVDIDLEYKGGSVTDYRGNPVRGPVHFGYHKFNAAIAWNVKFFSWRESENPRDVHAAPKDIATTFKRKAIKEMQTSDLDLSGPSMAPGLPNDHYATLAEGSFTVPAGTYRLDLTTDDGAKVWVDGKLVIADAWKYQGPTNYSADLKLDNSTHHIRLEHFQIDGYAALKVGLRPVADN